MHLNLRVQKKYQLISESVNQLLTIWNLEMLAHLKNAKRATKDAQIKITIAMVVYIGMVNGEKVGRVRTGIGLCCIIMRLNIFLELEFSQDY